MADQQVRKTANEDDEDRPAKREPRPSDRDGDERGRREPSAEDEDRRARRERDEDDGDEGAESESEQDESQLTDEQRSELEAKRARRREEKKNKRERERRERQEDRETIRLLREEMRGLKEQVNTGAHQGRLERLEDDLVEVDQVIARLRQAKRKAIEAVDPDAIEDIDDKLYRARRRKEDLTEAKQAIGKRKPEQAIDQNLIRHANSFMRELSWYDAKPGTDDEDSALVQAIDRKLMREGRLDPGSGEYWDELRDRVKKKLPHRFGRRTREEPDDDEHDEERSNGRSRRGSPPVAGRGESGSPNGGFQLTEEHRYALREAGIEPGTERYTKMIDQFKQAHKAQRAARPAA